MTDQAERLSDQEIGKRLRLAREGVKFTQQEAADAIKMARTTLAVIELGQRRARLEELQKLATIYKTSANAILRREASPVSGLPAGLSVAGAMISGTPSPAGVRTAPVTLTRAGGS